MKEVCVDARMLSSSGIGTYLRNLLVQLKDAPFRFKLIVRSDALQKHEWPIDCLGEFDLIFCDAQIYSIQEQLQLPRLIPTCDLFWSPHFNIPFLPIRARKRVVTVHDAYHLAFFNRLRFFEKCYARAIFARLKNYADSFITVSQFSKTELCTYAKFSSEKIFPISNGIDHVRFAAKDPEKIKALKQRYCLPEKFLLFVGNLKPHKNVQGLIRAFHLLQETNPSDYGLVVVGKRAKLRTAEQQLPEDLKIFILEDIEDEELPLLYQSATLFILPSFYEGFGLTPLEAMSSGCPVVVSRVASLPEVCGNAAEYVDPYDVADIARGISKVLNNGVLQEELKRKGFEQAAQFSWKKAAMEHVRIFEEVLR